MKEKFTLCIICCAMFFAAQLNAQCGGPRYIDSVFANYTITTDTYSTVYGLQMDIYQPDGDTASARPLLVLAHGGTFISGTRSNDSAIVQLCRYFSKRGYVVASIDYRLLSSAIDLLDSTKVVTEVMQAISDGKAAVRFFYKDAHTANNFKIDTNKIFIGGNSAGAVLFMQYAYIDSEAQVPPYLQAIMDSNGGIEGNSGNAGYSTAFRGVINLAGGLNNPDWMSACSAPLVSAQGSADPIVPYYCGDPEYGTIGVRLCGLGTLQPIISTNTPYWSSYVFVGAQHTPWQNNDSLMYIVDTLVNNFLFRSICTSVPTICPAALSNGISYIQQINNISLFPNPASDVVNVQASVPILNMFVYDETGRQVEQLTNINRLSYEINAAHFGKGVYFVKFDAGDNYSLAVKKMVIE